MIKTYTRFTPNWAGLPDVYALTKGTRTVLSQNLMQAARLAQADLTKMTKAQRLALKPAVVLECENKELKSVTALGGISRGDVDDYMESMFRDSKFTKMAQEVQHEWPVAAENMRMLSMVR